MALEASRPSLSLAAAHPKDFRPCSSGCKPKISSAAWVALGLCESKLEAQNAASPNPFLLA